MSGPSVTVQRAPDGWTHIGGPGMHLLIALDEEDERTLTASDAADGGDLDDVIDRLTTGGMRRAHHFVGVHWEPRTRLVAFGPVAARVVLADGSVRELRPTSPRVWTDLELDEHPVSVDLRVLDDTEATESPTVPLLLAPAPSSPSSERAAPPVPTVPSSSERAAPPVPTISSSPQEVPPASSTEHPNESSTRGASLPAWGSGAPVAVRRPPAPRPVDASGAAGNGAASASSAVYGGKGADGTGQRDVHSTWAARPPAEEPVEEEPAAPSYDYLFGGTVTAEEHRRLLAHVEPDDAAEQDDTAHQQPPSSLPAAPEPATPPTPPAPAPAPPAPAAPQPGGLISSVPWAKAPQPEPAAEAPPTPAFGGRHTPPPAPTLLPPTAPAPPAPPTPVMPHTVAAVPDDADLTVDRSALLAARNAALDGGPGPRVTAVLCTAGHPSPPHANHCRVCSLPIPPQEPFEMPRPALGVLRLSTGDVVTLDRNVLLGRAPRPADGLPPEEQPHVVKVPSAERDVSRNHVEVLVEGWHVLIRDLGTTNGTTVALPGDAPVRLRANDQQALEPGSVVSMADEVSFTYEVGP